MMEVRCSPVRAKIAHEAKQGRGTVGWMLLLKRPSYLHFWEHVAKWIGHWTQDHKV